MPRPAEPPLASSEGQADFSLPRLHVFVGHAETRAGDVVETIVALFIGEWDGGRFLLLGVERAEKAFRVGGHLARDVVRLARPNDRDREESEQGCTQKELPRHGF